MVTMLVYYRRREELEVFQKLCRELFAYLSEEELELYCYASAGMVRDFLAQGKLLDLACIGIMGQEEILLLQQLRKRYEKAEFMLIADAAVSPMKYLNPVIRASSLLLYPYEARQHQQVFFEFLDNFFKNRLQNSQNIRQDFLVIENREGKTAIPFPQIYYIEVRERKIFVRIRSREYSKYDSLEHMLDQLPGNFIRCHRSFVFNMQHLERIRLSENTVYLDHGITVPLSRSYKQTVKECVHGIYGK